MPSINGKFDPRLGILIPATVLPPGVFHAAQSDGNELQVQGWNALIDTGASHSCISDAIVTTLGLQPIGMTEVAGVHGSQTSAQFLVDLAIPFDIDGGAPFQILIGRDVIGMGVLTISSDGHFTLAL